MTNFRFPKRMRLLSAREFNRVFAARTSAADGLMILYAAANPLNHPRLGMVVSRKVGGAVARNRWKRSLREAFRLVQHELPALDLVCLPRGGAEPDVARLRASFPALCKRILRQLERGAERLAEKESAAPAESGPTE